jgi:predicted outer membrane protein
VAASPSATAGSAQPDDDKNGTNSTVASVFVVEAAKRVVDDRHTDAPERQGEGAG